MKTFAFVFARGGSKGLPGKNIRPLAGVTLLGHSIRIARQVRSVAQVWVSTDSEAIAEVALAEGARVIRRPEHLAIDAAPEWLAWQHAIEYLRQREESFDVFLSLPTTSPLRAVEDVERCLDLLDHSTDAVITVTPAARSPYFNMVTRDAEGRSGVVLRDRGVRRRQDAPPLFDVTTVAYATRPEFVMRVNGLFEGTVRSLVVPKERAVDIDDEFDFVVAEALYRVRRT